MGNMRYTKRITEVTRGLGGVPRVSHHLKQWFSSLVLILQQQLHLGTYQKYNILFLKGLFFFF